MNFLKKYYKASLIIILIFMFFIGTYFRFDFIIKWISILAVVISFILVTRSALNNLWDCFYYLLIIAPILGVTLGHYANGSKYLLNFPFSVYIYSVASYFIVCILVIYFGETKTVKLATLIIAQLFTALFLIINFAIYMFPIKDFNYFVAHNGVNIKEIYDIYGYDSRKFVELMLQLLWYPPLIVALLSYTIAEIKQYFQEKKSILQ